MIYLIGGVTKSGKSYLADKILKERGIHVFRTDFLLFGFGGDDGLFKYNDSDEKVSKILEPNLVKIISFLVMDNIDYVIEGTHITIELYEKLNKLYPNKFRIVFLGYDTDNKLNKYNQIMNHLDYLTNKWFLTISKEAFIDLLDKKINESKELKNKCSKLSLKYFTILNIKEEYKEVLDYLFVGM